MVISEKPIKKNIDEKKVDNLINKGGSVSKDAVDKTVNIDGDIKLKHVSLRLYSDMIEAIDSYRAKYIISKRKTRHEWIVDAIEQQLKREEKKFK